MGLGDYLDYKVAHHRKRSGFNSVLPQMVEQMLQL